LLLVGFVCALRRSELVALTVHDIAGSPPQAVTIRRSKTDQTGGGQKIAIPRVGGPLCPSAALQSWLDVGHISSGPIFRPINKWNQVGEGPLSAAAVRDVVRKRASDFCVLHVSAHSLRSGFVVAALNAGLSLPAVRGVTRHKTLQGLAHYAATVFPGRAEMAALLRAPAE
jgi:integrase